MKSDWLKVMTPMRFIMREFWDEAWKMLTLLSFVIIISSVVLVVIPYIFSRLVDELSGNSTGQVILLGFIVHAILMGISTVGQSITSELSFLVSQKIRTIANIRFFERVSKKTVGFFIDHNSAEIQSAQATGGHACMTVFQMGFNILIPGIVQVLLTIVVVGAAINSTVVLIVVVYGGLYVGLTFYITRLTRPALDAAITANQENSKFAGNAITAMETLRYFGADRWMSERFFETAEESYRNWYSFSSSQMHFSFVFGIALTVQLIITFFYLMPQFRAGVISVGDIVLFYMLIVQLNRPFEMAGITIGRMVDAYSRFKPYARMWSADEEPDVEWKEKLVLEKGTIQLVDVGHVYESGRGVSGVSFTARRGELTFITGETGAGKSTIFKLLLKSLDPSSGYIQVDGVDITEIPRKEWYRTIGVVPQEIILLNDSLKTNIALGREVDEEKLRAVARKAAILDRIESMPDGFDTLVGERGLKLSAGERQRIAIARALYTDPQILLLDEASSALDSVNEKAIMDHIRNYVNDVTIIAITHNLSIIHPKDHEVHLKAKLMGPEPQEKMLDTA